jgi:hypothetical protein
MKEFNIFAIATDQSISLTVNDQNYTIYSTEKHRYNNLKEKLTKFFEAKGKKDTKAIEKIGDEILGLLNPAKHISTFTEGDFEVRDNKLYFKDMLDEPLPIELGKKIIALRDQGEPYGTFLNFWKRLRNNPSKVSRNSFYTFIEKNHITLTEDGLVLLYKKVTERDKKLFDSHTKSIDNSIGSIVKMDRSKVNANPNETCSYGLHVAAWEYAQSYSGNVLVEVLVDPEHVVAVPTDYNAQKIRVCEYTVLGLGKSERKDHVIKTPKKEAEIIKPLPKIASIPEAPNPNQDLIALSASQIVKLVFDKTGIAITIGLKNKQGIVKKATELLANITPTKAKPRTISTPTVTKSVIQLKEVNLNRLSASQIVEKVRALTGDLITINLKNKQSIIKKATQILSDKGYTMITSI